MKLNHRIFKIFETKKYFKKDKFFFFFSGINISSNKLADETEQKVKKIDFTYYKILNKTTYKTLKKSIYSNIKFIIKGLTFVIKFNDNKKLLSKNNILTTLDLLFFILLAIKFNNKIYTTTMLKKINLLEYKKNKQLLHQFSAAIPKIFCKKFKRN